MAAGLGNAWTAGIDGLLIDTAPPDLRNRALAPAGAGITFTQRADSHCGAIAGQHPPPVVIPLAAAAGVIAATVLRPQRPAQAELVLTGLARLPDSCRAHVSGCRVKAGEATAQRRPQGQA
jgi:hypothetical protein